MAKAKRKPKVRSRKRDRAKQGYFEGMEPPSIKEIDRAAERYVDIRDERMALTPVEVKSKDALHALMKKHELKTYEFDGYIVSVEPSEETVKVAKKKEPKAPRKKKGDQEPAPEPAAATE